MAQALGAIENALLDAKAKPLGVPCYELLGGKIRDRIRVYWSHCATWRINHPTWYKPAITDLDGVKAIGREVREKKFTALKTNIFTYEDGKPKGWRPGFGSPFEPEINVDRKVLRDLRMHLEAIRDGAGPDVDILLDLNFNAKTEGYLKILREIADLDMFWIEIDSFNPEALGYIRRQSPHPISSCETLLGLREFLPYFREQAMDVAIIDTPWNGVWQSMKIAAAAEALRGQRRAAQFLRPPLHHDERALLRRRAEPAHHGDRHRSSRLGSRAVHPRAGDSRTAIWSCRTGPAGAPSRTRRRCAPIRRRATADCSTTAARAEARCEAAAVRIAFSHLNPCADLACGQRAGGPILTATTKKPSGGEIMRHPRLAAVCAALVTAFPGAVFPQSPRH